VSRLSTKHVVLGLMVDRPSYGYSLQQQFSERLGFLGLVDSGVYKTLERLEEDGWVEEVGGVAAIAGGSGGRTRRILYRATDEGVDEFRTWMAEPCDRAMLRDELQAKLAVAAPSDLPQLIEMAEGQAHQCLVELAQLQRPTLAVASAPDVPWPAAARMMVDDFKARWLEALVDWLNAIAEVMEERVRSSPADV
jgi:DNA-binding PadR family transcriptional regulator